MPDIFVFIARYFWLVALIINAINAAVMGGGCKS